MGAETAARSPIGADLLERDAELRRVDQLLERASAGVGSLVLVEGEAGIGKTALLAAARSATLEHGFRVLAGTGGELERDFAWGVVRQLYEAPLRALPVARRRLMLSGAAALAAPMLGLAEAEPAGPALDAMFAVNHGLYWLTANLAEEQPLALVVDDAHWADSATLLFLSYLGRRLDELPVLVLLGQRPAEPGSPRELLEPLGRLAASERVRLAGLSEPASGVVIERTLGARGDRRFLRACHQTTGGNPFLLGELLRALQDEEIEPGGRAVGRIERLGPRSIAQSVLGRLEAMWPEALGLAKAVALLGSEAELRHAQALAALDERAAAAAADALCEARILAAGRPLRFAHPILRQAVYQDIPQGRRATDHARAAKLLDAEGADPERVALQLLPAEPAADPWVVERLRAAASRALANGSPDAAVSLLRRALAEPPPPAQRTSSLLELGLAAWSLGHPEATAWLEGAVDAAADPNQRMMALLSAIGVEILQGREDEAVPSFFARAKPISGLLPELALQAEAIAKRYLTFFVRASADAAAHGWRFERAEPPAGETPAERAWLAAAALQAVMDNAPAAQVLELSERALASGTLLAEGGDSPLYTYAAVAIGYAGPLERAIALFDAALEDARRRGSFVALEWFLVIGADLRLRHGVVEEAMADALDSLATRGERGWALGLPWKLAVLTDAMREQGRLDSAESLLDDHRLGSEPPPRNLAGLILLDSRGRLRLAQGRADAALTDFLRVRDLLAEMKKPNSAAVCWRNGAALANHDLGETEQAHALADEQVELARRFGAPSNLGTALRVRAAVHPAGERIDTLREAVRVLEPGPARLEYAKALVELGCALRRANRRSEAREPLEQGMELAHRCRATAVTERARAELHVLGARPRRLVVSGVDALTASERRVAEKAAEGMTNREIAQALFVTRKTVEAHLGHAYQKLEIGSREELADALAGAA